jgi:hypothetical protein
VWGDAEPALEAGQWQEAGVLLWVSLVWPEEGEVVENPVTFLFEASDDVVFVELTAEDGWSLTGGLIAADPGSFTYTFRGTDRLRTITLGGYDADERWLAEDSRSFYPVNPRLLAEGEGFNRYVIWAINDVELFPKTGEYPYCYKGTCRPEVPIYYGMVHDAYYLGEFLFEGTGLCYCSGHTLEIFLDAYRRYQDWWGLAEAEPYGTLGVDDVNRGEFFRHWYGIGTAPDMGAGLEAFGIGEALGPDRWDEVQTGDFVGFSRSNGTGHAVIFINWVREDERIIGLRYYSCNGAGDSLPDPWDPENEPGTSGPSFETELFVEAGGKVLPSWLFVGHPYDPETL